MDDTNLTQNDDEYYGKFKESWKKIITTTMHQIPSYLKNNQDFSSLINSTIPLLNAIENFNQNIAPPAENSFNLNYLTYITISRFTEVWLQLVKNVILPKQLVSQLPFKHVQTQLLNFLLGFWEYNRIIELRQQFIQIGIQNSIGFNASECDSTVHQWLRFKDKWNEFENVSSSIINSHLNGNVQKLQELQKILFNFNEIYVNGFSSVSTFTPKSKSDQQNTTKSDKSKKTKNSQQQSTTAKTTLSPIELLRDINSLRRIIHYIKLALTSSLSESFTYFVYERVLQVIGEYTKSTSDSSNLSKKILSTIQDAGIPLDKLYTLRNSFSHVSGLLVDRRLNAETNNNNNSTSELISLLCKDLKKLGLVFNKALSHSEFVFIRQNAESAIPENQAHLSQEILACKNFVELEHVFKKYSNVGNLSHLQHYLQQTRLHTELSEINEFGRSNLEFPSTESESIQTYAFDYMLDKRKDITKSTITKVSEVIGIKKLHDEISLRDSSSTNTNAFSNKNVVKIKENAKELIELFIQIGIEACSLNQEIYESWINVFGLGLEFELNCEELALNPEWTEKTLDLEQADKIKLVSTLCLINKLKYLRNDSCNKNNENSPVCDDDAFVNLLVNARQGLLLTSRIPMICAQLNIKDSNVIKVLKDILGQMCPYNEIDLNIDDMIDAVVIWYGNKEFELKITESRKYAENRSILLRFINSKINQQEVTNICNTLTQNEFNSLKDDVLNELRRQSPNTKLICNYNDTNLKNWKIDLGTIVKASASYVTLKSKLKTLKSIREIVVAFQDFLKSIDIDESTKQEIICIFENQEKSRLETFASVRFNQLETLLINCGILEKSSNDNSITLCTSNNIGNGISEKTAARIINNPRTLAAIEMLVLDLTEVLGNICSFISHSNDKGSINYKINSALSCMLAPTELRNYLAHGNAVFDLLNNSNGNDVSTSTLANAITLVLDGKSLLALSKLLNKYEIIPQEFETLVKSNKIHEIHNEWLHKVLSSEDKPEKEIRLCLEQLSLFQQNSNWQQILVDLFSKNNNGEEADMFRTCPTTINNSNEQLQIKFCAGDALHAIVNGSEKKLEFLLQLQPSIIQFKFEYDWSLLHYAVCMTNFNYKILHVLLKNGANINYRDENGNAPLHIATIIKNNTAVAHLLDIRGIIINVINNHGLTPVHFAAQLGHTYILNRLLGKGAHPSLMTTNNWRPLHFAIGCKHEAAVKSLIKAGAPPNASSNGRLHPFELAMRPKVYYQPIFELLIPAAIQNSASKQIDDILICNAASEGCVECLKYLLDHNLTHVNVNPGSLTPLHTAAQRGQTKVIELFLSYDAPLDPIHKDTQLTPMSMAIDNAEYETAEFLINKGAKLDPRVIRSPIAQGNLNMLQILVERFKLDLNDLPQPGKTALECASLSRNLEIFKYIQGKINTNDQEMNKCFSIAITAGAINIVKYMVENQVTKNFIPDSDGKTPLHLSVDAGHLALTKYLIENYEQIKNINVLDDDENNPIVTAAKNEHWNIVHYLTIDIQLDPNLVEDNGKIVSIAAEENQWILVKKLIDKGWDCSSSYELDEFGDIQPIRTSIAGIAACKCKLSILQLLIESHGYNVNDLLEAEEKDQPFLRELFKLSNKNILHYLHSKGLNLAMTFGPDLESGLHVASFCGNISVMEFFLTDLNQDVNLTTCTDSTPMHEAVVGNSQKSLEFLIQRNANQSQRNNNGQTPLDLALSYGHYGLCKILIENSQSQILDIGNYLDVNGNSLLHKYCQGSCSSLQLLNYLIEIVGMNLFGQNSADETVLHLLASNSEVSDTDRINRIETFETAEVIILKAKQLGSVKDLKMMLNQKTRENGDTPLHLAIKRRNMAFINLLLENFMLNVNIRNNVGLSPYELAKSLNFDEDLLKKLKLEEIYDACSENHNNLECLITMGNIETIEYLIKTNTFKSFIDTYNYESSPMRLAITKDKWDIVNLLLKNFYCMNHQEQNSFLIGQDSYFLLEEACKCGQLDTIKLLLDKSENNVFLQNIKYLESLLVLVVQGGQTQLVEYFLKLNKLKRSLQIWTNENYITTLFHKAIEHGHNKIVQLFLEYGADTSVSSNDELKLKPIELAMSKANYEVVEMMLKYNPLTPDLPPWDRQEFNHWKSNCLKVKEESKNPK